MDSISTLPRPRQAWFAISRLGMSLAAGVVLSQCNSTPKSEIVVSVADQRMGIYDNGVLKKQYTISTSKFGLGDQPNSYRTPTGRLEVVGKFGHKLPVGAVMKSRQWNGEVLRPNAPGRDPIVSRILWLRGMESSNRNAMKRFIYIHGTPEESRLGQPASYGCIRMGMQDVVDVFNEINIGAKVVVTKEHLPHGAKPAKAKPLPQPEELPGAAPAPITPPGAENAAGPVLADAKTKAKPQNPIAAPPVPTVAATPVKAPTSPAEARSSAPVPVPDDYIEQQQGKGGRSFFGLFSRSKGQSASPAAEVQAPASQPVVAADSKSKTEAANTAPVGKGNNKKGSIQPGSEHLIGPAVPEQVAKSKGRKNQAETASGGNSLTRLFGFKSEG